MTKIIWYSGGQHHVIYTYPDDRVAYHLTSVDGIHDWTDQGLAFDPRDGQRLYSNEDGNISCWFNVERPNVIMENGHTAYFTFAVSDVFKMGISGSSNNNTKVIVIPFDGVSYDQETGIGGTDGGIGDSGRPRWFHRQRGLRWERWDQPKRRKPWNRRGRGQ